MCFSYLFVFLRVCIPGICKCLFALLSIINYILSSDGVSCFEFHCCSLVLFILFQVLMLYCIIYVQTSLIWCHILVFLPDHLLKEGF